MTWFSKRIVSGEGILVLPGAFDALSAKLVAESGAEAVYCGGFATTASQFGLPDLGLLGLSDMVEIYRRISRVVGDCPLIVDGDAGHGGLLNVERTAALLAEAGVDAFHIEDQISPKRCGHLAGKDVVTFSEAVARVGAAVRSGGSAVIARTDAIAVHGFDDAMDRANAFLDVGACAVFIDAPTSLKQVENIPQRVNGPVIFNAAPTGTGPDVSTETLGSMGYAAVIHPIEAILATMDAVKSTTNKLLAQPKLGGASTFNDINELLGNRRFLESERELASNWQGAERSVGT